jgi:hypothetical protein
MTHVPEAQTHGQGYSLHAVTVLFAARFASQPIALDAMRSSPSEPIRRVGQNGGCRDRLDAVRFRSPRIAIRWRDAEHFFHGRHAFRHPDQTGFAQRPHTVPSGDLAQFA